MDVITAQLMIQGTIKIGRFHVCVKIIQQLTSETCQGYFFGRGFSFRFLHRHSGFASGHCNGTVAIEFHPKIEKNIHVLTSSNVKYCGKNKSRLIK